MASSTPCIVPYTAGLRVFDPISLEAEPVLVFSNELPTDGPPFFRRELNQEFLERCSVIVGYRSELPENMPDAIRWMKCETLIELATRALESKQYRVQVEFINELQIFIKIPVGKQQTEENAEPSFNELEIDLLDVDMHHPKLSGLDLSQDRIYMLAEHLTALCANIREVALAYAVNCCNSACLGIVRRPADWNENAFSSCIMCNTMQCRECHIDLAAHQGRSCWQIAEANRLNALDDPLIRFKLRKGLVQPCPSCEMPTDRIDGCNHILCGNCQNHWCWACGLDKIDQKFQPTYRHYAAGVHHPNRCLMALIGFDAFAFPVEGESYSVQIRRYIRHRIALRNAAKYQAAIERKPTDPTDESMLTDLFGEHANESWLFPWTPTEQMPVDPEETDEAKLRETDPAFNSYAYQVDRNGMPLVQAREPAREQARVQAREQDDSDDDSDDDDELVDLGEPWLVPEFAGFVEEEPVQRGRPVPRADEEDQDQNDQAPAPGPLVRRPPALDLRLIEEENHGDVVPLNGDAPDQNQDQEQNQEQNQDEPDDAIME